MFGDFEFRQEILCSIVGRVLSTVTPRPFEPNVATGTDALDRKNPAPCLFRFGCGIELYTYVVSRIGALWDNSLDCDSRSMDGLQNGRNL